MVLDPKHRKAVYLDANGNERFILAKDLDQPFRLQEARSHTLFNPTWDFRLSVRGGEHPHFFAIATGARRWTDDREEGDPAHNERIRHLIKELTALSSDACVELGTNTWNEPGENKGRWAPFAEIKDYRWHDEVTRTLSADTRCRHDVFGARATDLNFTGRYPWVAIEVIHHHYPREETLTGLLELSRMQPLVVLFDLVQLRNYFVHINAKERTIRAIYYIYNGSLWENDKELGSQIKASELEAMIKRMLERKIGRAA